MDRYLQSALLPLPVRRLDLTLSVALQVGSNKSKLETRTTSQGLWMGVHEEEWEGNLHVTEADDNASNQQQGVLVFSGDRIPWHVGQYEVSVSFQKASVGLDLMA